jgi:hypothetical protein
MTLKLKYAELDNQELQRSIGDNNKKVGNSTRALLYLVFVIEIAATSVGI